MHLLRLFIAALLLTASSSLQASHPEITFLNETGRNLRLALVASSLPPCEFDLRETGETVIKLSTVLQRGQQWSHAKDVLRQKLPNMNYPYPQDPCQILLALIQTSPASQHVIDQSFYLSYSLENKYFHSDTLTIIEDSRFVITDISIHTTDKPRKFRVFLSEGAKIMITEVDASITTEIPVNPYEYFDLSDRTKPKETLIEHNAFQIISYLPYGVELSLLFDEKGELSENHIMENCQQWPIETRDPFRRYFLVCLNEYQSNQINPIATRIFLDLAEFMKEPLAPFIDLDVLQADSSEHVYFHDLTQTVLIMGTLPELGATYELIIEDRDIKLKKVDTPSKNWPETTNLTRYPPKMVTSSRRSSKGSRKGRRVSTKLAKAGSLAGSGQTTPQDSPRQRASSLSQSTFNRSLPKIPKLAHLRLQLRSKSCGNLNALKEKPAEINGALLEEISEEEYQTFLESKE